MKTNKIIFLDIDGVVTSSKSRYAFSKECFDALGRILDETGAKIVISSSWRWDNDVARTIKSLTDSSHMLVGDNPFPFPEKIVGVTPRIGERGIEIACYLESHPCDRFAILDDDEFDILKYYEKNFFHIDSNFGLTEEDANRIIKFLNE